MKYFVIVLALLSISSYANDNRREKAFQYFKNGEYAESAKIYEELADNGDKFAEYSIALFYARGFHYERSPDKAIEIYKSLCEEFVEPCNSLGNVYKSQDQYFLAEKAYKKAAWSGDLKAIGNLSGLYYTKKWEAHDYEKAKCWRDMLNSSDWDSYNQRKPLTQHVSEGSKLEECE